MVCLKLIFESNKTYNTQPNGKPVYNTSDISKKSEELAKIPVVSSLSNDKIKRQIKYNFNDKDNTKTPISNLSKNKNNISDRGEDSRANRIELSENNAIKLIANSSINSNYKRYEINNKNIDNNVIETSAPIKYSVFQIIPDASSNLNMEVKNAVNWNNPQETISPKQYSKFNNTELSVFYKINNKLYIGSGLKQETFYTEYTHNDKNGDIYQYREQPNLTTVGVFIRYKTQLFENLSAHGQAGFGFNQAGIVIKPSLSFEYMISDRIGILIGSEYNYFRYSHQSRWNYSQKFSLNYGISYIF